MKFYLKLDTFRKPPVKNLIAWIYLKRFYVPWHLKHTWIYLEQLFGNLKICLERRRISRLRRHFEISFLRIFYFTCWWKTWPLTCTVHLIKRNCPRLIGLAFLSVLCSKFMSFSRICQRFLLLPFQLS